MVDERLAAPFTADANDFIYAWESSASFDPTPGLPKITAPLLAINADDDERNPPITGLSEQAMATIKGARLLLIPASPESRGGGSGGAGEALHEGGGAWVASGAMVPSSTSRHRRPGVAWPSADERSHCSC